MFQSFQADRALNGLCATRFQHIACWIFYHLDTNFVILFSFDVNLCKQKDTKRTTVTVAILDFGSGYAIGTWGGETVSPGWPPRTTTSDKSTRLVFWSLNFSRSSSEMSQISNKKVKTLMNKLEKTPGFLMLFAFVEWRDLKRICRFVESCQITRAFQTQWSVRL